MQNTLIGQIARAKEKKSLARVGTTIRGLIYRQLPNLSPRELDHLSISDIGLLLGNNWVEPDASEVAGAERIMADRVSKVEAFQAKRRERQKAKKAKKKR